jgi:hypothetical protein
VALEPEVVEWIGGLSDEEFGRVEFYIDLLEGKGVHLGEPYTRQLRGKLRELRFYLGPVGDAVRVSYYIASRRRIILLTVFKKQRRRERDRDRSGRASHETLHRGSARGGGRR